MLVDTDRQKLLTRRAAVLGGGKLVLLSALMGRLYYLQVVEADRYATLADENRISLRMLPCHGVGSLTVLASRLPLISKTTALYSFPKTRVTLIIL